MHTRKRANENTLDLPTESERLSALWKEAATADAAPTSESIAMTSSDLEQVVADAAKRAFETPSLAPVAFTALPERALTTRALVAAATLLGVAILGGSYALARPRPQTSPSTAAITTSAALQEAVATAERPAPVASTQPDETAETSEGSPSLPAALAIAATETEERTRAPVARRTRPTLPAPAAPSAPDAPAAPVEALPLAPTRADVAAAMAAVAPAVQECAGAAHGLAEVHVVVAGSGRVSSALVTGTFTGTPTGSCIARAMRTGSFPAFAGPSFTFVYPIQL